MIANPTQPGSRTKKGLYQLSTCWWYTSLFRAHLQE